MKKLLLNIRRHPLGARRFQSPVFSGPFAVAALLALALLARAASAAPAPESAPPKTLGIYVHQHWSYNHPYAARTWTLDDWRGYLDGTHRLGFNTVLIWPVLETMPQPLTPSDKANLDKITAVIRLAHDEFAMRVHIVLCPNVAAKNDDARKFTFEKRPFFRTDARVDPGDPAAFGPLMAWREELLRPLKAMDGLFIIDSDPGGYPHSTNLEFAYILGAHRRVLDRLRPGIQLYYWAHAGWEAYGRYYATGDFKAAKPDELRGAIALIAKQHLEPWGVATAGPDLADPLGMGDRVMSYPYGSIESEPSFPLTRFGEPRTAAGAKRVGQRGIMGNAQTHCVQLPSTFAFARIAQGLSAEKADFVKFGNDLLPGCGETIVEGWEALQSQDIARLNRAADRVAALLGGRLQPGPLQGLLFGDPARFVDDLMLQLRMVAAFHTFRAALDVQPRDPAQVRTALHAFAEAADRWQKKHGYTDVWRWVPLADAFAKLDAPAVNATLKTLELDPGDGATPFERVAGRLARRETYTLKLLAALKQTADAMPP